MEPDENAPVAEWKVWAQRLKSRAKSSEERAKNANSELRKAREDIENKEKAFAYYKQKIADIENTIENLKSNKYYRALKFCGRIGSKIKRIFR